jgi:hypothetical protein
MVRLSAQKIANAVPTYHRDSQEAITSLREMGPPPNAILVTVDATDMYTNIETGIGLAAVQHWLIDFDSKLPEKNPFHYRHKIPRNGDDTQHISI